MIVLIISLLAVLFVIYGLWTNRQLDHERLELTTRQGCSLKGLKVVQVSDIHLRRLRVPTTRLLKEIQLVQPDLILLTGDTIDRTEDFSVTPLVELVNAFATIAPTYVIEGNHEETCRDFDHWRQLILASEATLLENEVHSFSFHDKTIGLAGLRNEVTDLPPEEKERLAQYDATLLLVHHPELYDDYLANFRDTSVETIFTGHAHGGQIRLPLIGGILGPDNTVFPKYSNGLYHKEAEAITLIVSRGLGNSRFPLRINNKPHLITVTYK